MTHPTSCGAVRRRPAVRDASAQAAGDAAWSARMPTVCLCTWSANFVLRCRHSDRLVRWLRAASSLLPGELNAAETGWTPDQGILILRSICRWCTTQRLLGSTASWHRRSRLSMYRLRTSTKRCVTILALPDALRGPDRPRAGGACCSVSREFAARCPMPSRGGCRAA